MSDLLGGIPISIIKSTSYMRMYHDLQNKLNVNHSQYDIELRFLFKERSSIPIPPMKVTFTAEVNYLLELNKMYTTPHYVTLVRMDVI